MKKQLLIGFILSSSCVSSAAYADATLTYLDGQESSKMQIKGTQLKATSQHDPSYAMLYDASNNSITMIDHREKTYMLMTESTMRTMGNVASSMQDQIAQQLEAQMAGMSPEERAQMEQMMGALMPSTSQKAAPPAIRIEETGNKDKVSDWSCQIYDVYQGQQKVSSACMARASDLDLSQSDYGVLRGFVEFTQSMAKEMPINESSLPDIPLEGDLVPVSMQNLSGSEGAITLGSANNDSISADDFAIPAGYQQQNLMDMMR